MRKKNRFWIKSKKKLALLFVTIISVVSCFAIAMASSAITLKVSKIDDASQGDTVTISVDLENPDNEEYTSIIFSLNYDPDTLTVSDYNIPGTLKISLDNQPILNINKDDGEIYVALSNDEGNGMTYSGTVITIEFTVSNTAAGQQDLTFGEYEVTYIEEFDSGTDTELNVTPEEGYVYVDVPVEDVSLAETNITLDKSDNATGKIEVQYTPENTTTEKNYSFVSNDTDVVTVDDEGNLTAVGNGSTTVTVNAFGESFTANVSVITSITSITLEESSLSINKGETDSIVATVNPSTTSMDKTLTYVSSNEDVATVASDGTVTAVAGGNATITITSVNDVVATCEVKVVVPITKATMSTSNLELNKGESDQLTVEIEPADATDTDITWKSSDESVATVASDGTVTAVGGGNATITASVGSYELTTSVKVNVPITSFDLSETSVELLPTQIKTITYTVTPSDFTGDDTVTWESSDTGIATVASDGTITAVASGSTTISATIQGITKEVNVKVLIPIDTFTISESTKTMNKGDSGKLTVTITPANAEEDKTVTWESSNSSVVSVDSNGNIEALAGGVATITGTLANGKTVECVVTVVVAVDTFTVDNSSIEINKGETEDVTATITPSDVTYPEITWKSNDETVATVVENTTGVATIKGVGAGSTTITGTLKTGETVTVSVKVNVPITSVTISGNDVSNNKLEIEKSNNSQLVATVGPTDTTEDTTVTWKSSNTDVVTVDANGYVTAIAGGTATISATAGSVTTKVDVNVVVPITSIEVTGASDTLIKNKTLTLKATVNPTDTTEDTTVTWKSSDESIATVDENGVVTGISAGNVTITAELTNGMSDTYDIMVEIIPVNSISFDTNSVTINKNDTQQLKIVVDPIDATEIEKIIYSSSDESVATVDENGVITGISEGTATITAKMGIYETTIDVTIEEIHLESISIANDLSNISVGDIIDIKLILNPTNTTDDLTFTYTSSDESIVTIDENGHLIALGKGEVTITVIAFNGVEKSYTITVAGIESPVTGVESAGLFGVLALLFLSGTFITAKKIKE